MPDEGSAAIAGSTSRLGPGPPRQNRLPSGLRTELGGKSLRLRRVWGREWRRGLGGHKEAFPCRCSKDYHTQACLLEPKSEEQTVIAATTHLKMFQCFSLIYQIKATV